MPDISNRTIFFGPQKCLSSGKMRKFNDDHAAAGIAALNAFDPPATNNVAPTILVNDRDNGRFVIFVRSSIAHPNFGDDIHLWKLCGVAAR